MQNSIGLNVKVGQISRPQSALSMDISGTTLSILPPSETSLSFFPTYTMVQAGNNKVWAYNLNTNLMQPGTYFLTVQGDDSTSKPYSGSESLSITIDDGSAP